MEILDGSGHTGRLLFMNANNLNSTSNIFEINNKGTGTLIRAFTNKILGSGKYVSHLTTNNVQSNTFTLAVETNGTYGPILGITTGSGFGSIFMSTNTTGASSKASALNGLNYGSGHGILGYSALQNGVNARTDGNAGSALYASVSQANLSSAWAGYFYGNVNVIGSYFSYGSKFGGSMVKNQNGNPKAIAAEESTEEWVSDYSFGELVNGTTTITIEAEFASIVNTTEPYHVFIQLEGDCLNGVKVTNKTATSFTVTEQGSNQNCNAQFSYRINAKRKGFENLRIPTESQVKAATAAHLETVWPELIIEENNKNINLTSDINASSINSSHIVVTPNEEPEFIPNLSPLPATPIHPPVNSLQPSNPNIQNENTIQPPY